MPAFYWLCKNRKTGEITIAQKPNALLTVTAISFVIRFALEIYNGPNGLVSIARWTSTGLLLFFGLDELVRGVNPWRRIMGTTICVLAMSSIINLAN